MSRDRELGDALSEGLNTIAAIVSLCPTELAPHADWGRSLEQMESAFAAVKAGEVRASIVVQARHEESLRRLRDVVGSWASGTRPAETEVRGLANVVASAFGDPHLVLGA